MNKLLRIQTKLICPKKRFNKFGGYYYRSCEDILEAVKPLLLEECVSLIMSDKVVPIINSAYIEATVSLLEDKKEIASTSACARESPSRKGFDEPQLTGSASSYARKTALCGLFGIDDNPDSDSFNNTNNTKDVNVDPTPDPTPDPALTAFSKLVINLEKKELLIKKFIELESREERISLYRNVQAGIRNNNIKDFIDGLSS
jgi:hypothetical protein